VKRAVLLCGCLLLLVPSLRAEAPDRKATVAYLVGLQNKDGGFRPSADVDKASLRATSSAIRAIKYLGGDLPNRAACAKFVESCFDKESGGFADAPGGKADVAVTAVGLMAVTELKLDADRYVGPACKYLDDHARSFEEVRIAVAGFEAVGRKPAHADAWAEQVRKTANADGTFGSGAGKARDTGSAEVVLLRLGQKPDKPEALVKALQEGQLADGGFGKEGKESDLESTYRILRCFHMLNARPSDSGRLRNFIAACRNRDGGYGVAPGRPSSVSGTYFAAIVTHWLDEK